MGLPKGLGASVDAPQRMTLVHPKTGKVLREIVTDDEGKAVPGREAYIDLYSSDSELVAKHQRAVTAKRLSRRNKANLTIEEIEESGIETLVVLTADWFLVTLEGEPIEDFPCTPENARAIYGAPSMAWIKRQVDEFAGEVGNFVKDSSKS
jgi:hypothetical protein